MLNATDNSIEMPRNGYWERRPARGLERHVACVWVSRVGAGSSPSIKRVVPDGCIDVVWLNGGLQVAGPDTGPVLARLDPGSLIVGVRFRPGLGPTLLGVPAMGLVDARVDLEALWGRAAGRLAERLAGAPGAERAMALLEGEVMARLPAAGPPDPLAETIVAELRRAPRSPVVPRIAAAVGSSERQLHRRCLAAFGYGPKTLDRVLRFQRFLALASRPDRPALPGRSDGPRRPDPADPPTETRWADGAARRGPDLGLPVRDLARLAAEAGYADQAHLSRECRSLAGLPPRLLLSS